ncbi:putative porin [Cyclobacteriaceae bacterium]|nr:putative porin [Cyclobacteriaceae bacterium]
MKLKSVINNSVKSVLGCCLILIGHFTFAQFNPKPDSLINKFGPHTTTYSTEDDYLFNNTGQRRYIDTVMQNGHLFQSFFRFDGDPYQDLGAFGTSQIAYYKQSDKEIGTHFGFNAWNQFIYGHNDVKYFDTYSPYSRLEYVQGMDGQQIFSTGFSRSVSKNFNFGFNLKGFGANKTIGKNTDRSRFTDNLSVNINGRFVSDNQRYVVLANFRHFKQKQNETGGYYRDTVTYDYFADPFPVSNLVAPETKMKENTWRLYQQFSLSNDTSVNGRVQLFYVAERKMQRMSYYDDQVSVARSEVDGRSNGDFYGQVFFDPDLTNDSTRFTVFSNKVGVKGTFGDFYYQGFYKRRDHKYQIHDTLHLGWHDENYLGGAVRYKMGAHSQLDVATEYETTPDNPLYTISITPRFRWFRLALKSQRQTANAIQQYYVGNHYLWSNSFKHIETDEVDFSFKLKKGKSLFHPFVGYQRINNYIYYDEKATPTQYQEQIDVFYAGMRYKTALGRFNFLGYGKFYNPWNTEVLRAPRLFIYQQVYYESHFKNNLHFQLGIDAYYRSTYKAYEFSPATQQFYVQNTHTSESYWVFDAFINFKLKSALLFLKIPNVANVFGNSGQYEITPGYPGIGATFVFGVEWMFFD